MGTNKSFVDFISAFRCNNNNSCQTWNFIWHTHAHHGSKTCVFVSDIFSNSRHPQMNSPWMFTLRFMLTSFGAFFFRRIFVAICIHKIVPSGEDLMMMLSSLWSVNISWIEKHSLDSWDRGEADVKCKQFIHMGFMDRESGDRVFYDYVRSCLYKFKIQHSNLFSKCNSCQITVRRMELRCLTFNG